MKFIFTLLSIVFLFSSCAGPHTTVKKHKRYHKQKLQGPDFPDIGNLGPAPTTDW